MGLLRTAGNFGKSELVVAKQVRYTSDRYSRLETVRFDHLPNLLLLLKQVARHEKLPLENPRAPVARSGPFVAWADEYAAFKRDGTATGNSYVQVTVRYSYPKATESPEVIARKPLRINTKLLPDVLSCTERLLCRHTVCSFCPNAAQAKLGNCPLQPAKRQLEEQRFRKASGEASPDLASVSASPVTDSLRPEVYTPPPPSPAPKPAAKRPGRGRRKKEA